MAGRKGERFLSLSTDKKPKQFLKLLGEETTIKMTIERRNKLIPMKRIFIFTAKSYVSLVNEQLLYLTIRNIITGLVGRNTVPCIASYSAIVN
jgi:mannose-1-phosphate guanylyltransferase